MKTIRLLVTLMSSFMDDEQAYDTGALGDVITIGALRKREFIHSSLEIPIHRSITLNHSLSTKVCGKRGISFDGKTDIIRGLLCQRLTVTYRI